MSDDLRILVAGDDETVLREISELAHEIWREHYPGILSDAQIEYMLRHGYSVDRLRAEMRGGMRYDRACLGEEAIGFVAWGESETQDLLIYKLYVRADARGRGVSRRLLEAPEGYAIRNGLDWLVLHVNKRNQLALDVYRRLGFAVREPVVKDIGSGFVMDDYVMERAVG